jgi:hypothetical protein
MKLVNFILNVSILLVVLCILEGLITFGAAFNFENYSVFGYVFQGLLVSITVCVSVQIWYDEQRKEEFKLNR